MVWMGARDFRHRSNMSLLRFVCKLNTPSVLLHYSAFSTLAERCICESAACYCVNEYCFSKKYNSSKDNKYFFLHRSVYRLSFEFLFLSEKSWIPGIAGLKVCLSVQFDIFNSMPTSIRLRIYSTATLTSTFRQIVYKNTKNK